ncbi:MAG: ATP-grasp domain-containing protein [Candidatus Dojkabacteria bacterium]
MNPITEKLLESINKKLNEKPLFYFSRDVERALGLESILENYFTGSIESSYLTDSLKNSVGKEHILSLEDEGESLQSDSTLELVKNFKISEWIKENTPKGFYSQFFHFNQPAVKVVEDLGGKVFNNSAELNRKFEGKLNQLKIFEENHIPIANSFIANISELSFRDSNLKLTVPDGRQETQNSKLVIQTDRAHTGSGTFFVTNQEEFEQIKKDLDGNMVRVSEMIDGQSYTINGCVTKKGVFIAGLQYQITGIAELTPGKGSTIGNDWSHGFKSLNEDLRKKIYDVTKKLGEVMQKDGYKGLYGVDLVVKDKDIFVIEINARQTANIPLQTKLELQQDQVPLSLINLAEWLELDIPFEPNKEILPLEGSQVFLRSKKEGFVIKEELKSGIYRLQSDSSAINKSSTEVIYIDEEQDKPLIWQKDGYSIDYIDEGGFVILFQKKNQIRNKFDEVARMQFTGQIVFSDTLSPWVIEAMKAIEDRVR